MKDPSSFFLAYFRIMFGNNTNLDWFLTKEQTVNTHREEKLNTNNNYETDFVLGIKEYKAKKITCPQKDEGNLLLF